MKDINVLRCYYTSDVLLAVSFHQDRNMNVGELKSL